MSSKSGSKKKKVISASDLYDNDEEIALKLQEGTIQKWLIQT